MKIPFLYFNRNQVWENSYYNQIKRQNNCGWFWFKWKRSTNFKI